MLTNINMNMNAYKLCLNYVSLFVFSIFDDVKKRGEINELIRERDKKGRIIDIVYECIY